MKVTFLKLNVAQHRLSIVRDNSTTEAVVLDSSTYFLHDLCHFVVEQELQLSEGFWGMLNKGYSFEELSGKTNPLTEELRKVECIVGGAQALYMGNQTLDGYWQYLEAVNITINTPEFLERSLTKIDVLNKKFSYLPVGSEFTLHFAV